MLSSIIVQALQAGLFWHLLSGIPVNARVVKPGAKTTANSTEAFLESPSPRLGSSSSIEAKSRVLASSASAACLSAWLCDKLEDFSICLIGLFLYILIKISMLQVQMLPILDYIYPLNVF